MIYKNLKEKDVFVPYKSSMRLWKFKLQTGAFMNFHIPNKSQLIRLLEKHQPIDVWFTNGLFLNAKNLERSTYKTRLIKKNLVFDMDDVDLKEVKKLIDFLKPYLLELDYIINTSKNSYQISFKNNYDEEIIKEIINEGIKIDKKIYDERRVIRCPLTYHHSGHFIDFIDFIDYSSLDLKNRQESVSDDKKHFSLKEMRSKENLSNPAPKLYIPTFINNINKKAILYLKFKGKNLDWIKHYISRLDKAYHLGFAVIRINDGDIDVICPRAFEIARLKKIYKNKKTGIKYFEVKKFKDKELFVTKEFYKYEYSRPHLKYINKFELPITYDLKKIGGENPTLIYS